MANDQLGKLITDQGRRDAIHVAIAPVTADKRLFPGQHVGFIDGSQERVSTQAAKCIGIVDPFLEASVDEGERFYMVLYPNTITTLRHHWEHPAFGTKDSDDGTQASRIWLTMFAARLGWTYEELIGIAKDYWASGDFYVGDSEGEYDWWREEWPELTKHLRNVGIRVESPTEDDYFRCAC